MKSLKALLVFHYGTMIFSMLIYCILTLFVQRYPDRWIWFEPNSQTGIVLQSIIIIVALTTIPYGLYWFKRRCLTLRTIEDTGEREKRYFAASAIREALVVCSLPLSTVGFFLLGGYQTMLWIAAIAAIAWFFCKPSERRMELDLNTTPYDDRY